MLTSRRRAIRFTLIALLGCAVGCSGSKSIINEEVSPDVPPIPTCTQDEQCAHLTNNCGKGFCNGQTSQCTVQFHPLGSACDVELDCALGRCISGICSPEIILDCDDANPCTEDICDPVKGCVFLKKKEGLCNDNNPCTEDDRCTDGICTAGDYICDECTDNDGCDQYDDQNACNGVLFCNTATNQCHIEAGSISTCVSASPCMSAVCNVATGLCQEHPRPNGSACSDNNLCSLEDRCSDGQCVGTPLLCPPADKSCVTTTCAPKSACMNTSLTGPPCQDGNQCTSDDVCAAGTCSGTTVETCNCIQDTDCALFDDANLCNGQVRCMEGHCLIDPATIPTCTPPGVPCVSVQCVPQSGECTTTFTLGPCSDGDLCTIDDHCADGTCIGAPAECDDNNECTNDLCDPSIGCVAETIPDCDTQKCQAEMVGMCGACGTRTCVDDMWGPCHNEKACVASTTEDTPCGKCGLKTRTCLAGCEWGPYTQCIQDDALCGSCNEGHECYAGLCCTCSPSDICGAGIDNMLSSIAGLFNDKWNDSIIDGTNNFLIEFSGDYAGGEVFSLRFYAGELDPSNAGCDFNTGPCLWQLSQNSLKPDCTGLITFGNAKIVDGKLTAGGVGGVFYLAIPAADIVLDLTVLHARIEADVTMEGGQVKALTGLLGGAIPKQILHDAIDNVDPEKLPVAKEVLINLLDTIILNDIDTLGADGNPGADGVLDSASVAIKIEASPATITGFQTPTEPGGAICAEPPTTFGTALRVQSLQIGTSGKTGEGLDIDGICLIPDAEAQEWCPVD